MSDPTERTVRWQATGDAEFPYRAEVDGQTWTVRVNDWPDDETVYSLLIEGEVAVDFDDWPARTWGKRP
ncbi:MAG: hypothetical protein KC583_05805 [Myxococcales bacterium]|nr:hypothetical protein [Myxococcales bacterium]